jgi:hypothetical protein
MPTGVNLNARTLNELTIGVLPAVDRGVDLGIADANRVGVMVQETLRRTSTTDGSKSFAGSTRTFAMLDEFARRRQRSDHRAGSASTAQSAPSRRKARSNWIAEGPQLASENR